MTVSLSVPTDRALCRSYRSPRSPRSRSSMTWRSSCRAWSTCPGAWPRLQLSATRALYRGPEGSGGDLFGCSDTGGAARRLAWDTRERTEPAGAPILSPQPPPAAWLQRRHVRNIDVALDELVVSPRRSLPARGFRQAPFASWASGNASSAFDVPPARAPSPAEPRTPSRTRPGLRDSCICAENSKRVGAERRWTATYALRGSCTGRRSRC